MNPIYSSDSPALFDFHGGIHPAENKHQSTQVPIRKGPLPTQLVLPLNMHIGAPAKPLVEPGERVLKGQCIAAAKGPVSAPVHAPTSGTIESIGPRPIQHPSGLDAPCIVLRPDGKEEWVELHPLAAPFQSDRQSLLEQIRNAGIAGMGGAGFPTSIKVNLPNEKQIEQLVINAVECEPYITADDMLMREQAEQVIAGIELLQHLLQPAETLVGIEDNKPEAIASMRAAASQSKAPIRIISVPTKYPSGGEKQLIQLLTGKEVPSGRLPADVGVVCQNTGTVHAIYKAVYLGEPLISRITTLTGEAFREPGNVEVLIGTPVQELLTFAGAEPEQIHRLVMGGPMMGFAIHNPQVPVVKTSNCLIAAPARELPSPEPEQPCIRCGSCAEVCPASLLPQQLYWYSKNEEFERAQQYNLMDCIECGACSWVCPSNIPLVQYYRFAKGEVRHIAAAQQKADKARERFEARTERLEKAQAEKEAKRQARLEANRKKKQAQADGASSNVAAEEQLKQLKAASLEASKAYKAAVKEAKAAEQEGADNAAELRSKADQLKARADAAKTAVREAGNAAPAAPQEDLVGPLKKAVGDASKAYKAAIKEAKAAEQEGSDNAAELRSKADELKAEADRLKAELRDAKANAPAAATPIAAANDPVSELKKAVGEASKAYKAAVKEAKAAEEEGSDNVAELRSKADELKAEADRLKAELRDAKATAPASPVAAPSTAAPSPEPEQNNQSQELAEKTAKRAQKMKALKTAYNMANKQWKEASAALERAHRASPDNDELTTLQAKVDKLKFKADKAREALDLLVNEAKADLAQETGSDLKTLKLEAAKTSSAAREKAQQLASAQETGDDEQIRLLQKELEILENEASLAAKQLKQATDQQGLTES